MKKTLIIFALALVSFANAQKGTVLVTGNFSYSSQKVKYNNTVQQNQYENFSISPKIGYQFNDNWTVGGEFSFFKNYNEYFYNSSYLNASYDQKGFSVGAFMRYSKPLNETFSFYTDLGIGIHKIKENRLNYDGFQYYNTLSKGNGFYTNITPALFINIKKGFGLNFNIGGLSYGTINYDNNGGDNKNFNVNFGKTISIGVSKNF